MNRRNFLASAIAATVAPTAFSKTEIPYFDGGSIPIPAPEKFFAGTNEVWATSSTAMSVTDVTITLETLRKAHAALKQFRSNPIYETNMKMEEGNA